MEVVDSVVDKESISSDRNWLRFSCFGKSIQTIIDSKRFFSFFNNLSELSLSFVSWASTSMDAVAKGIRM